MKLANLKSSILVLLFACTANMFGQNPPKEKFLVGEVSKSVILYQGKKKLAVTPGDELPLCAMLTIPENGKLVVYSEARMRQYTILQAGTFSLAELLNNSRKKNVPEKTFRGIIKLVTSSDNLPDGQATIDREIRVDTDSIKACEK